MYVLGKHVPMLLLLGRCLRTAWSMVTPSTGDTCVLYFALVMYFSSTLRIYREFPRRPREQFERATLA